MKWTEALVIERLRAHFAAFDARYGQVNAHAMLTQVPCGGRVIDALVLSDDPVERIAIEIKVSRADFRNDTDEKRAPSWAVAHRCLYAAPAGLIDPAGLPSGWGLIEVHEAAPAVLVEHGQEHQPVIGNDPLTYAALRRAAAAEAAIRLGDLPAAEVARLRLEVDRHAAAAERAQAARERYRQQALAARSELLAIAGMQECADCGAAITWVRSDRLDQFWQHVSPEQHAACLKARQEANRLRRESEHGAAYAWGFAVPVEPLAARQVWARQEAEDELAERSAS